MIGERTDIVLRYWVGHEQFAAGKDQTLKRGRDALGCLDFRLQVVDSIAQRGLNWDHLMRFDESINETGISSKKSALSSSREKSAGTLPVKVMIFKFTAAPLSITTGSGGEF